MRNKLGMFLILQALITCAYAEDQGAAAYDWQTCVNEKIGSCLNGCAYSQNTHCATNCKEAAHDKCEAEGLSPS